MKRIISILMIFIALVTIPSCSCKEDNDDDLSYGIWVDSSYASFASEEYWGNKIVKLVNEYGFNEAYILDDISYNIQIVVQSLNRLNIDVYHLNSYDNYLNDPSELDTYVNKYRLHQAYYPDAKYAGCHLDMKLEEHKDFATNRQELLYKFIDIINTLKNNYPDIVFGYTIPSDLDDEITYNEVTKKAYQHIIDIADRVILTNSLGSADAIYQIGKEELEYGKNANKQILLSINESIEEFYNGGVDYVASVIEELKKKEFYNGVVVDDLPRHNRLKSRED